MPGASPWKRWISTLPTCAASREASSASNSPVAAPARSSAKRILFASKAARSPLRLTTSRGSVKTVAFMGFPVRSRWAKTLYVAFTIPIGHYM